jgi:L-amino acid N-acyltransferase YncA
VKIINLRTHLTYLEKYISLRNSCHNQLLTNIVTTEETEEWLRHTNPEILIAVENQDVTGLCIMHIHRKGEISICVKYQNKGIGSLLLRKMETRAKKRKLSAVWAWVSKNNTVSLNFFYKNGFKADGEQIKQYNGENNIGNKFKKEIE